MACTQPNRRKFSNLSFFTACLPVDKTSCDGNSNIEIAPTSLVWNGSAAVANSWFPSPHDTARTALSKWCIELEKGRYDATNRSQVTNKIQSCKLQERTLCEASLLLSHRLSHWIDELVHRHTQSKDTESPNLDLSPKVHLYGDLEL